MIASMTGFGRARWEHERFAVEVEASSVNRKGLEVVLSAPREWFAAEPCAQELARKRFHRGKIYLQLRVQWAARTESPLPPLEAIAPALEDLREVARQTQATFNPDARLLLDLAQLLQQQQGLPAWDKVSGPLEQTMAEALDSLATMRLAEGRQLEADVRQRVALLQDLAGQIRETSRQAVPRYRETLLERLRGMGLEIDLDDERVLKEIALFADRADNAEELTRLESHLAQTLETLEAHGAPAGRKLDFIVQEIHRELNTLASKSQLLPVTQAAIAARNELERLREQAQNIE